MVKMPVSNHYCAKLENYSRIRKEMKQNIRKKTIIGWYNKKSVAPNGTTPYLIVGNSRLVCYERETLEVDNCEFLVS